MPHKRKYRAMSFLWYRENETEKKTFNLEVCIDEFFSFSLSN